MRTQATRHFRGLVRQRLTGAFVVGLSLGATWLSVSPGSSLSAQPQPRGAGVVPRADRRVFRADSFWVRTWIRGGSAEEDLFVEPRKLASADKALAVLDMGTREVHLLSTVDGTTKRVMKASGSGPGEFTQPWTLVRDRRLFGILDNGNARVSMFTTGGTLVWDAPVREASTVEGACIFSRARLLVKGRGRGNALTLTDSSGTLRGRFSLPDTAKDKVDALGASASVAGPSRTDHCAIVPLYGARWFTITARGKITPHRYIEAGAEPKVEVAVTVAEKRIASKDYMVSQRTEVDPIARSAHMIGDTLVVAAGATKRDPLRLLDYYLMSTGRYLYSRKLPAVFTALTVGGDGTFYAAVIASEVSWVVAFTPSRTEPTSQPSRSQPPRGQPPRGQPPRGQRQR